MKCSCDVLFSHSRLASTFHCKSVQLLYFRRKQSRRSGFFPRCIWSGMVRFKAKEIAEMASFLQRFRAREPDQSCFRNLSSTFTFVQDLFLIISGFPSSSSSLFLSLRWITKKRLVNEYEKIRNRSFWSRSLGFGSAICCRWFLASDEYTDHICGAAEMENWFSFLVRVFLESFVWFAMPKLIQARLSGYRWGWGTKVVDRLSYSSKSSFVAQLVFFSSTLYFLSVHPLIASACPHSSSILSCFWISFEHARELLALFKGFRGLSKQAWFWKSISCLWSFSVLLFHEEADCN